MTFPDLRSEVLVELAFGADKTASSATWPWTDVSADRLDDPISIERGRQDEMSEARPSSCGLVLDNPHGHYTPDQPRSPHYPNVAEGTPLRVSLGTPHVGAADDDPTDVTSHIAPSVAATKAGLLVCTWFGADDADAYTLPGGMTPGPATVGLASRMATATEQVPAGPTGTRTATVTTPKPFVASSAVLHGDATVVEESLGAAGSDVDLTLTTAPTTLAGWWLVAVQAWNVFPQERVRFMPDAPQDDENGWILLGDSGVSKPDSFDHNQIRVWARRVGVDGAVVVRFPGNIPAVSSLNNEQHAHLLVLSGVDDWSVRATTEAASWEPTWPHGDLSDLADPADLADPDAKRGESRVGLESAGILRRLGQGEEPLHSPIRRFLTGELLSGLDPGAGPGTLVPVAYWPLEDAPDSTAAASAFAGQPRMRVADGEVEFGAVDGPAGSLQLPDMLQSTGTLTGRVTGASPFVWVVGFLIQYEATNVWSAVDIQLSGPGVPYARLRLRFSSTIELQGIAEDGTVTSEGTSGTDLSDGRWYLFELRGNVAGGTVSWAIRATAEDGTFATIGGAGFVSIGSVTGSAAGPVTGLVARNRVSGDSASLGHLMVWQSAESEPRQLLIEALDGHADEPAGKRIERLCAERMITFHAAGDLQDTTPMGPQPAATLLDIVRECETADMGVLYEPRQAIGLAYRTRTSLYNQGVTLPLDAAAGGQGDIVQPFAPVRDDAAIRNDITVTRSPDGGTARAVQTTGPRSVEAVGRYPDDPSVNVSSDLQLPGQAGWRLHLGTWPGMRYPAVSPALDVSPGIVPAWQTLDVGDRIEVSHLPPQHPPGTVELLAQGYAETIRPHSWEAEVNCAPAGPYTVGVWADDAEVPGPAEPKRYSPSDSRVNASFRAGTDTALAVADQTGGNDLWSQAADLPFDILVRGVRLRVTAVGVPAGAVQVLTVEQAPVNGVTGVTIAAGERVQLWQPARYAL